jgi:hypothetical protein
VKPTRQPGELKNKQDLKNKVVIACCVEVKQQKIDLIRFSTTEIFNKEDKYKLILRMIENTTRPLHSQHS